MELAGTDERTVAVSEGLLLGRALNGVSGFFSVPYAAPPVGALRFAKPEPPSPWSGVRDARRPGATAPQRLSPYPRIDIFALAGNGWIPGDDYLTLNVWAPARTVARPVMIWIHGGGCVVGSKDAAVTDGTGFARSGIVCVAINYRLGVEGFLPIPGAPTNLALRDMICALAWVRTNIAAFGGDPDNVTIFGESGGGMHVSALVSSPLAKGLFRRAIVQSGHGSSAYAIPIAQRTVAKLASLLGVSPDIDGFRSVDIERMLAAQQKVSRPGGLDLRDADGLDPGFGVGRFSTVFGDDVLPMAPIEAAAAGSGGDVDLLIGTTAQEGNFWFVPTRLEWWMPAIASRWLLSKVMRRAPEVLKAYGLGKPGARAGAVLNRVLTDVGFRWPARQFAAAHRGRTHMFEFDWRSNACNGRLGACHGVDLPFTFDTLDRANGPKGIAGTNPPRILARKMQRLWVGFATDGTLPWPEFDDRTRMVYQLHAGRAVHEPVLPAAAFLP